MKKHTGPIHLQNRGNIGHVASNTSNLYQYRQGISGYQNFMQMLKANEKLRMGKDHQLHESARLLIILLTQVFIFF